MAGRGKRYGNEEEQSRKLFVGGLSFDTTDEKLQEYFSQWGKITDSVVIKEKNSTRSKGFGFVTYDTEEEADQCMGHRPHSLQGRTVDVKRAVSREESARPGAHVSVKKIFVGGLKDHHTEEEIRNFFEQHGSIDTIEMMVDKNTGKTRGFGFVTFTDYDTVDKLVAKRHYDIGGSRCEIKKALSRAEMDKAKADAEAKAMRSDYGAGRGGGGGGGGFGGRSQNGYDGFGRGGGGGGYGGYGDGGFGGRDAGYGSYGGEGYGGGYGYDGYGRGGGGYGGGYAPDYGSAYGSAYGSGSTHYGPMRATAQYTQRSSGPYGGGFGSGGGQGGGYAAGGYGTGANGGYNNGQGGSYGGGQGGGNYGGGRY